MFKHTIRSFDFKELTLNVVNNMEFFSVDAAKTGNLFLIPMLIISENHP